jgi:predicted RNA-binding Zn-ribbon protein involved in translation (DUF1610 family)
MIYFICPYCGKQLENQARYVVPGASENEFFCDDCGKVYVVEQDAIVEEEI